MKVIVYSAREFEISYLEDANTTGHDLIFEPRPLNLSTSKIAAGCQSALIFSRDDASAPVLEQLANYGVKYISIRATGFDQVDLAAAQKLGIKVANVPAYSPRAIAEHAVMMILALNRKLIPARKNIERFDFRLDHLVGFDLCGKTVGVIGTGQIGRAAVRILNGFGCNVLGYDLNPDPELVSKGMCRYVDLESLIRSCDIISLHVPLNEKTHHLINGKILAEVKEGAMLINTGRGSLVETAAVVESLNSGRLGYFGMDVYENEKKIFFIDHEGKPPEDEMFLGLMNRENVLITGHQAFLTSDALKNIADRSMKNLDDWSAGKRALNELIPS